MPKKEINYQNTIIYKIVCNDLNVKDVYVGNTTDFTKRKWSHKSDCYNDHTYRCDPAESFSGTPMLRDRSSHRKSTACPIHARKLSLESVYSLR